MFSIKSNIIYLFAKININIFYLNRKLYTNIIIWLFLKFVDQLSIYD